MAQDQLAIGSWAVFRETPGFASPPHDEFALVDRSVLGSSLNDL